MEVLGKYYKLYLDTKKQLKICHLVMVKIFYHFSTTKLGLYIIKSYIDNNYQSILSLDSLSQQFSINKYSLSKKFKLVFNENIIKYYHNKRISDIKHLLVKTDLSITSIAELFNFNDIYSFSRFFKNIIGISPSEFRNKYLEIKNGIK